jgi:hypothetical protein
VNFDKGMKTRNENKKSKIMKRTGIISMALVAVMISFTACESEEDNGNSSLEALELEAETAQETTYEAIDQNVEEAFEAITEEGRVAEDGSNISDCVVVTHDAENKVVTLDFGDEGCTGHLGNVHTGTIEVEYNMRRYEPGAYRIITFVDYAINGIEVSGTRTITNTSVSDAVRTFTVELEGGMLDFGDGVSSTREASWERSWFIGQGTVTLSGTASGTTVNGVEYTANVSENDPITFSRACLQRIPVSGLKSWTVGENVSSIDYGDGECDRLAEITVGGSTFTRRITPRRGRR